MIDGQKPTLQKYFKRTKKPKPCVYYSVSDFGPHRPFLCFSVVEIKAWLPRELSVLKALIKFTLLLLQGKKRRGRENTREPRINNPSSAEKKGEAEWWTKLQLRK